MGIDGEQWLKRLGGYSSGVQRKDGDDNTLNPTELVAWGRRDVLVWMVWLSKRNLVTSLQTCSQRMEQGPGVFSEKHCFSRCFE